MTQGVTTTKTIDERIADLLQGAIDPHVHSGPSIAPRGVDHLELLEAYSAAGVAAVVTKDHDRHPRRPRGSRASPTSWSRARSPRPTVSPACASASASRIPRWPR